MSDTTTLYQRRNEMTFECLGPNGEYREWSSNRDFLISGTWSVSDGDICQHLWRESLKKVVTFCKKKTDKVTDIAAVFSHDTLNLMGCKHIYCKIDYRTIDKVGRTEPDPESMINALMVAAALMDKDDEEFSDKSCDNYIYENNYD